MGGCGPGEETGGWERGRQRRPGADSPPLPLGHPAPPGLSTPRVGPDFPGPQPSPVLRAPVGTKVSLYDPVGQEEPRWSSGQHYCSSNGPDDTRAVTGDQRTRLAISCQL